MEAETESVVNAAGRLSEHVWVCEWGLSAKASVVSALLLFWDRIRLSDTVAAACCSGIDPGTGSGNVSIAMHALLILIDSLG